MLTLLSPAKSLDFDSRLATTKFSEPRLVDESEKLIDVMRDKSPSDIMKLMKVSEDLATLNAERYGKFNPEHTPKNSRAAVLAFNGDVYQGLETQTFDARDFTEAQKTIRILSGLYGLLRPLDLIQPHRLEMGTRLATERGKNLYDWWGNTVTDLLKQDLAESPGSEVIVNLASNEYYGVVNASRLGVRVISPRFEDRGPDGNPRVVSFHAKRARGLMAAWLVKDRARTPSRIEEFSAEGYVLDYARSTKDQPVFVR